VHDRREFLKVLTGCGIFVGYPPLCAAQTNPLGRLATTPADRDPWDEMPRILARISAPQFQDREFNILKFGALGDNKTDCTPAFHNAIVACHQAGGGRVIVPEGEFLTGPIQLLSHVNLNLHSAATIRFSSDPRSYPLVFTRWEGTELMNFSPFVYAFEQENIAITGSGTLDGYADCRHWWFWRGQRGCDPQPGDPDQTKDRNLLQAMGEKGVPVNERVFGEGHYLRPQFIQPYRCKNVLIEGIKLLNSPMWHVHPVLCTNVTIRKLTIHSAGPNTDGCDPESCTDVLIEDCVFNTGDDCIAIKSGRNADGRRLHAPSQNIIIRGCHMSDGHGGVTIGSEISGGVRNVFAENCQMDSPRLDVALRIKNNAARGGLLENICARNIVVGQVATAGLSIDFHYEEGEAGGFVPVVRDVDIRDLHVQQTKYPLYLRGLKNAPIESIQLTGCTFASATQPNLVENVSSLVLRDVRVNGRLVEEKNILSRSELPWTNSTPA
jgi:polygalacturonase